MIQNDSIFCLEGGRRLSATLFPHPFFEVHKTVHILCSSSSLFSQQFNEAETVTTSLRSLKKLHDWLGIWILACLFLGQHSHHYTALGVILLYWQRKALLDPISPTLAQPSKLLLYWETVRHKLCELISFIVPSAVGQTGKMFSNLKFCSFGLQFSETGTAISNKSSRSLSQTQSFMLKYINKPLLRERGCAKNFVAIIPLNLTTTLGNQWYCHFMDGELRAKCFKCVPCYNTGHADLKNIGSQAAFVFVSSKAGSPTVLSNPSWPLINM